MIVKNNGFLTIEQLQDQYLNGVTGNTPVKTTDGKSFQEILESTQGSREVRFSKHAAQRLSNRNIELTEGTLAGRNRQSFSKGNQRITGACGSAGIYCEHSQ